MAFEAVQQLLGTWVSISVHIDIISCGWATECCRRPINNVNATFHFKVVENHTEVQAQWQGTRDALEEIFLGSAPTSSAQIDEDTFMGLSAADGHCFSYYFAGPAEEDLVVVYSVQGGWALGPAPRFVCGSNSSTIGDLKCKHTTPTSTWVTQVNLDEAGEAPFHGGKVHLVGAVLRRHLPSSSRASVSTSSAPSGVAITTAAAEESAPSVLIAGVAGAAASMVGLMLLAACIAMRWRALATRHHFWRRKRSRREGEHHGKGGHGRSRKEEVTPEDWEPVAVEPFSEDCIAGRITVGQFADVQHFLIPPEAISIGGEEAVAVDASNATLRFGLLHGRSKVLVKEAPVATPEHKAAIINELRILRRARHSNLILFQGVAVGEGAALVRIVLEWIQGTDLLSYVRSRRGSGAFASQLLKLQQEGAGQALVHEHHVLIDVLQALRHLHHMRPPVFHLGLRPSAVQVDKRTPPCGKVSDFSLSRSSDGGSWLDSLPLPLGVECDEWRACAAPELLEGGVWHGPADVFAFGRLSLFACTGQLAEVSSLSKQLEECAGACSGTLARVPRAARWCLALEAGERPDIDTVYRWLSDPSRSLDEDGGADLASHASSRETPERREFGP